MSGKDTPAIVGDSGSSHIYCTCLWSPSVIKHCNDYFLAIGQLVSAGYVDINGCIRSTVSKVVGMGYMKVPKSYSASRVCDVHVRRGFQHGEMVHVEVAQRSIYVVQ